MSDESIRVMLVDDHELVLTSVRDLLMHEEDIEVVATARDGLEAIEVAGNVSPDVIIMDVFMPELDGIHAAGRIHQQNPAAEIIMFSMHKDSTLVQQARKNGAVAFISKQRAKSDLVPAIRDANGGKLRQG